MFSASCRILDDPSSYESFKLVGRGKTDRLRSQHLRAVDPAANNCSAQITDERFNFRYFCHAVPPVRYGAVVGSAVGCSGGVAGNVGVTAGNDSVGAGSVSVIVGAGNVRDVKGVDVVVGAGGTVSRGTAVAVCGTAVAVCGTRVFVGVTVGVFVGNGVGVQGGSDGVGVDVGVAVPVASAVVVGPS